MIFTWTFLLARWANLIDKGEFYAFILVISAILDFCIIAAIMTHYGF